MRSATRRTRRWCSVASRKKKLSAAVLPLAYNTGRVLVGYRSQFCWEPFAWAAFGGAKDPEDACLADTAIRELLEETGYAGHIELYPGVNVSHPRSEGHVFIGLVEREFRPKLNWEHVAARWVYPHQLNPEALHWSLVQLFDACL